MLLTEQTGVFSPDSGDAPARPEIRCLYAMSTITHLNCLSRMVSGQVTDTAATEALVKKWVVFYKSHRQVLDGKVTSYSLDRAITFLCRQSFSPRLFLQDQ
jgi:hypothetical protein